LHFYESTIYRDKQNVLQFPFAGAGHTVGGPSVQRR